MIIFYTKVLFESMRRINFSSVPFIFSKSSNKAPNNFRQRRACLFDPPKVEPGWAASAEHSESRWRKLFVALFEGFEKGKCYEWNIYLNKTFE